MHMCYAIIFIELQKANSSYEEKLQEGCSKDKTLFSLSWDIEELKAMNEEGRRMRIEISSLLNLSPTSFQSVNAWSQEANGNSAAIL